MPAHSDWSIADTECTGCVAKFEGGRLKPRRGALCEGRMPEHVTSDPKDSAPHTHADRLESCKQFNCPLVLEGVPLGSAANLIGPRAEGIRLAKCPNHSASPKAQGKIYQSLPTATNSTIILAVTRNWAGKCEPGAMVYQAQNPTGVADKATTATRKCLPDRPVML